MQHAAKIGPRIGVVGVEMNGATRRASQPPRVVPDREPALPRLNQPTAAGVASDELAELRFGSGEIAAESKTIGRADLELRVVGFNLAATRKASARRRSRSVGAEPSPGSPGKPSSAAGVPRPGRSIGGLGGLPALQGEQPRKMERVGVLRIRGKCLTVKAIGFLQAAGLMVGQPLAYEIIDGCAHGLRREGRALRGGEGRRDVAYLQHRYSKTGDISVDFVAEIRNAFGTILSTAAIYK